MPVFMKPGSPFLFDQETGDIVGVKDSDGGEQFFPTSAEVAAQAAAIAAVEGRALQIDPSAGLQIGGAGLTPAQKGVVRAGIGGLSRIFPLANTLPNWRLALSKTIAGVAPSKIVLLGDSTMMGSGATGVTGYQPHTRAVSPPVTLANELFTALAVAARADSFVGAGLQADYRKYDARFSYDAGWTSGVTLNGAFGGTFRGTVSGAVISITPDSKWDRAKIYYAQSASQGLFGVYVGDVQVATGLGNGATALASYTVSALKSEVQQLRILKENATTSYILAVEFWDSATNDVRIVQMGSSGAKAGSFALSANAWDGINMLTALDPDLTIIGLGINDWTAATNTTDYTNQINTWITAARSGGGDVILFTQYPTRALSVSLATQQTYVDILVGLAASGVVVVDQWRRMIDYERNSGTLYTDWTHPNGYGYADGVRAMLSALAVV